MKADDYLDPTRVKQLVADGYIEMKKHPTEALWILDYSRKTQWESNWTLETTRCRGLIVSDTDVVARPFEKFFNWQQMDRSMIANTGPIRVQDKMDGSLGVLYREPSTGLLAISTRGSFTSPQALHATEVLRDHYPDFEPDPGFTYLFEIVYPENRIVVDYGDMDDLVLLDVIDNEEGDSVLDIESNWPGPVVQSYDFETVEDVLNSQPREGREGYVVYFKKNASRLKIKHDEYVRLHKIITEVSSKSIWEALATGASMEKMLDRVPDEFDAWVRSTANGLQNAYEAAWRELDDAFEEIMSRIPPEVAALPDLSSRRKWFVSEAKGTEHEHLLYNLHNIHVAIWKGLEPAHTKPFWAQDGAE
jgi:RNA ligase